MHDAQQHPMPAANGLEASLAAVDGHLGAEKQVAAVLARVRAEREWAVRTLHTGHDAFISEPDALAALLDQVAANLG